MHRDSRTWFLARLDLFLSEEQRQLPSDALFRYRVLVGAAILNLALILQYMLIGSWSERDPFYLVEGPLAAAGYLGVLVLVSRTSSPRLPALLLCSVFTAGVVAASFFMDFPLVASHAAIMLIPMLAAYLLGARLGLVFSVIMGLNALLLHPLHRAGYDLSRPLFPDAEARMASISAALAFLAGWALSWLHGAAREAAHESLEQVTKTLRDSESKLVSLIESTDDLVMALDTRGHLVTANQAVRRLFLQSQGREARTGEPILDTLPPELRTCMRERLAQALGGQRVRMETSLRLDGRLLTVETTISPILGEGGHVVGVTFFGRDITARKEAETRLGEMHRGLLDVSRRAGMAEIAIGILHNVGNTLNSVNVSASLVTERMSELRVSGLMKTAELLREHEADLGTFFTIDPRGRQLPAYIQAVADQFAREREAVLAEMRALSQSVEHIKLVVNMQQKHARISGVLEWVSVPELIEDALRLNAVSFERLGIQLRREYAGVPPVLVDRHKLLQVLVNLLSNARYALLESEREDKWLAIRVEQAGERLRIAVADNGVGIAPEVLPRLFTQGFTTRKDGHGFGLHTSALAAEELGGSLTCASAGRGQGATFTLELPVRKEEKAEEKVEDKPEDKAAPRGEGRPVAS